MFPVVDVALYCSGPNAGSNWRRELLRIAQASVELTLLASGLCGTFMGAMVAVGELDRGKEGGWDGEGLLGAQELAAESMVTL